MTKPLRLIIDPEGDAWYTGEILFNDKKSLHVAFNITGNNGVPISEIKTQIRRHPTGSWLEVSNNTEEVEGEIVQTGETVMTNTWYHTLKVNALGAYSVRFLLMTESVVNPKTGNYLVL